MRELEPRVIYDQSLLDTGVPYTINVDSRKVVELLREFKASEEAIRRLTVAVKKDDPHEAASYEYSPLDKTHEINIYGDDAWEAYKEARETVERIVQKEEEPQNQFEDLLYTRKLPAYLSVAPRERALAFADKLLRNAINREINADFLHEARHVIDYSLGKYRIWFGLGKIADMLGFLVGKFDKAEKSATDFERQIRNNPRWRNLVTIQPKSIF